MAKFLAIAGTKDDSAFLVHENITVTEAGGDKEKSSTSVVYNFVGFQEEKPRTREEKKAKVPATIGPSASNLLSSVPSSRAHSSSE